MRGGPATAQPRNRRRKGGCTVAEYAKAKRLPGGLPALPGDLRLQGHRWPDARVLRIPYRDARRATSPPCGSGMRSTAPRPLSLAQGLEAARCTGSTGSTAAARGRAGRGRVRLSHPLAPRHPGARAAGRRTAGGDAATPQQLAASSASTWWSSPTRAARPCIGWLAQSAIRDRAWLVELGEHKDPSGLYLADPDRFKQRWQDGARALPSRGASSRSRSRDRRASRGRRERCAELAHEAAHPRRASPRTSRRPGLDRRGDER